MAVLWAGAIWRRWHSSRIPFSRSLVRSCSSQKMTFSGDDFEEGYDETFGDADEKFLMVWNKFLSSRLRECLSELKKWRLEADGNDLSKKHFFHLLSRLKYRGRPMQALEVLQWAIDNRVYELEARDYAMQIDLLSAAHKVSQAQRLYDSLPAAMKTQEVFEQLIAGYAADNQLRKAERAMDSAQVQSAMTCNLMMNLYLRLGMDDSVEALYEDKFRGSGITPTPVTFMILMANKDRLVGLQGLEKDLEDSLKDFKDLDAEQVTRQRHRSHLMVLHGHLGELSQVKQMWSSIRAEANIQVGSFLCAMNAYSLVGKLEQAEVVFEEAIKAKPHSLRKITLHMIRTYSRVGDMEKAEQLTGTLGKLKGLLRTGIYNSLITGYLARKDTFRALEKVKEAYHPLHCLEMRADYRTALGLMPVYEELGDVHAAHRILRSFGERGDAKLYNGLLRIYLRIGKPLGRFESRMRGNGVEPNEETMRLLRTAL